MCRYNLRLIIYHFKSNHYRGLLPCVWPYTSGAHNPCTPHTSTHRTHQCSEDVLSFYIHNMVCPLYRPFLDRVVWSCLRSKEGRAPLVPLVTLRVGSTYSVAMGSSLLREVLLKYNNLYFVFLRIKRYYLLVTLIVIIDPFELTD